MAISIHPSRSCLLPFYTVPIFPLLNQKIFHLLVSSLFLGCTLHIKFVSTLWNIFPEAICCLPTSYFYAVLLESVMYVRLATIANMGQL